MKTTLHKTQPAKSSATFKPKGQEPANAKKENALNQQSPKFGFNFANIPAISAWSAVQPKLTVGQPNDKYEQEADRMAESIMSNQKTPDLNLGSEGESVQNKIQPKCADCEEEEMLQTKLNGNVSMPEIQRQEEEEEEEIMMKRENASSQNAMVQAEQVLPGSGGKPLPAKTKSFFENHFGYDFSKVRVHHDEKAGKAARSIHAKAYTHKNNIVFGNGYFNPQNREGQKLLAHELTHVIQQGKAPRMGKNSSTSLHTPATPVIQKKGGPPKKEENTGIKQSLKAQKQVWDDLRAFFPDDIGKVAGTGFKESGGYLQTDFSEDKEGASTSSAPIINVGIDYLKEKDDDKRKEKLGEEVKKINQWRLDNGRIVNDDLKNTKEKNMLQDLPADKKLALIGKLKERKGADNDEVIAHLNKTMQSTPIVEGATARDEGGFEVKFDNVTIVVLPDVYNSSAVASGAVTKIKPVPETNDWFKTPGYNWDGQGKIKSMTFTPTKPDIKYTVQTFYSSGANPRDTSGYGVGTRAEDTTKEHKTLGFHEGQHGEEFINSIRTGTSSIKWPEYTGKVNDDREPFEEAHEEWKKDVAKFNKMLNDAHHENIQIVDCSGKTIEEYHKEKGTSTTVHCNP
ncbi:MAG: DUF4157 domain-containing protein [Bacteroidales bacterium]|nr:DUF4157 domain-containing protein [Bacteroidales bacterium]